MNTPCRKSGFTLIELLVVISISTVMLSLVTIWIGQTLRFSTLLRNHERQQLQLARLARSLRDDVRLSKSMTIEDGQRLVLESGPQQQTIYTISGTEVQVEKQTGSQIRHDRFRLSVNSQPVWDTDQMPETIGLVIERRFDAVERPATRNPAERTDTNRIAIADGEQSDESNRSEFEMTDPKKLPIDIHIFASINRYPVDFISGNQE